jgi:NAD(P)-dependent dehydrogenase (short-subunit alcohol dehydrogenase family)
MAAALKVVVTGASSGIGRAAAIGPLITLLSSPPDRLADRAKQRALGAS